MGTREINIPHLDDYIAHAKEAGIIDEGPHDIEELLDNEDFVEFAMSIDKYRETYRYCSERLKLDRDYTLRLLKQGIMDTQYEMVDNFKDDEEIAGYILAIEPDYYIFLSKRLQGMKEIAEVAVNNMGDFWQFMKYAPEEFRDNLDYAYIRLNRGSYREFFYLSKRIQSRKDIVLLALEKGMSLGNIPKELKADKEFMLTLLEKSKSRTKGNIYGCASKELRHDREFALACFSHFISLRALCGNEGYSYTKDTVLSLYPTEFLNDRELAFKLICNLYNYEGNLKYLISEELVEDREFFMAAFQERLKKGNSIELSGLPDYILDDEEFARFCMDLKFNGEPKDTEDSYARHLIDTNYFGEVKEEYYISERLWDKEDFAEYAVLSHPHMMNFVSHRLHKDRDFILRLLNQGAKLHIGTLLDDDEEITYRILDIYPEDYRWLSKGMRMKPEIALFALKKGCPVEDIDKDLCLDREFACKAVEINKDIYWVFPEETRNDAQVTFRAINHTVSYYEEVEDRYEVQDLDYVYYTHNVLRRELNVIGPKLKEDPDFTEKLVDAFLKTGLARGATKEEFMADFPAFYERINTIFGEGLDLDQYIED